MKSDLNLVNFEQNLGFATIDKRWENQDDIRENVFNEAQKAYSTTLELQDRFHEEFCPIYALSLRLALKFLVEILKSRIYQDVAQNRSRVRRVLPKQTVLKRYTNEVLFVEYLAACNKKSKFIHATSVSHFSYVFQEWLKFFA